MIKKERGKEGREGQGGDTLGSYLLTYVPYLSALEVRSRRGAIQIHVSHEVGCVVQW